MTNNEQVQTEKISFDVLVVGAGLAGCAAAAIAARGGLHVALIERGQNAGSKNIFGGTIYTHSLVDIYPDFFDRKPPLERPVTEAGYWMLSQDGIVKITTQGGHLNTSPADAFIAQMAVFDAWWAAQAIKEGVFLIPKTTVTDFIKDPSGKVIGIKTDRPDGDLYAPIVILCEGVNNILTQKLGLIQSDLKPSLAALTVKQLISLPADTINARFGFPDTNHGLAVSVMGDISMGMTGLGFVYTGTESISVGVGVPLEQLEENKVKPYALLERFMNHPSISPLIAGGRMMEYGAHLIPEGGYDHMPTLYTDGVMVAGDAATMVNALHWEGTNMAIVAGKAAGETAVEAFQKKDFSARSLKAYQEKLQNNFVLQDLRQYRKFSKFLETHEDFMDVYPTFINEAFGTFMSSFGTPKKQMYDHIIKSLTSRKSMYHAAGDILSFGRAITGR